MELVVAGTGTWLGTCPNAEPGKWMACLEDNFAQRIWVESWETVPVGPQAEV